MMRSFVTKSPRTVSGSRGTKDPFDMRSPVELGSSSWRGSSIGLGCEEPLRRSRVRARLMRGALTGLTLVAGALAAGACGTESPGVASAASTKGTTSTTDYFQFEMSPGFTLHHFLYQWARSDSAAIIERRADVQVFERALWLDPEEARSLSEGLATDGPAPASPDVAASLEAVWSEANDRTARLAAETPHPRPRQTWDESLLWYRRNVAGQSHFDDPMQAVKNALMDVSAPEDLEDPATREVLEAAIPGITDVLAAAWPVYDHVWWSAHRTLAEAWIAEIAPLVDAHEEAYVDALEGIYETTWPQDPIRVEGIAYANWAGAYSSHNPNHVVIGVTDPLMWGDKGLEMVFHEASHSKPTGDRIRTLVSEAADRGGVEPSDRLWHAVLFYTAGEISKRIQTQAGNGPYEAYAEHVGLYRNQGWSGFYDALNTHWLPVIEAVMDDDATQRSGNGGAPESDTPVSDTPEPDPATAPIDRVDAMVKVIEAIEASRS